MNVMKKSIKRIMASVMVCALVFTGAFTMPDMFNSKVSAATKPVVTLTNLTSGVKVSWTKKTNITGYYVYRQSQGSTKWKKVKTVKSYKTTSWTDTSTYGDKMYKYYVKPYKKKKTYTRSSIKSIYRMKRATFSLETLNVGGTVTVKFNPKNRDGYQFVFATDSAFKDWADEITEDMSKDTFLIDYLDFGRKYYIKARSFKKVNGVKYYSPYSVVQEVMPYVAPPEPGDPDEPGEPGAERPIAKAVVDLATDIWANWKTMYGHQSDQPVKIGEPNPVDGIVRFDCSGFVSYVHNMILKDYNELYHPWTPSNKVRLSTTIKTLHDTKIIQGGSKYQDYEVQTIKTIDELLPGDVIFFKEYGQSSGYNHCGIYIGDNKFIHSSSQPQYAGREEGGVTLSELDKNFTTKFLEGKRYIPDRFIPRY